MPYFVGKLLGTATHCDGELVVVSILNDYLIDLWKRQIGLIMGKHGLVSFIVYPDYIINNQERQTYEALLAHLAKLRSRVGGMDHRR